MALPGSFMSHTSSHRSAGRSGNNTTTTTTTSSSLTADAPGRLVLSTRSLRSASSLSHHDNESAGASASPVSPQDLVHRPPRSSSRQNLTPDMSSSPSSSSINPTKTTSTGKHAKLHKRGPSSSPFASATHIPFTTPFATYEEQFPDVAPTPPLSSSVPKIKPYLRSMSTNAKQDQGSIDLSKSMSGNDHLAGLGIQDFATKSAADVSFAHSSRRGHGHGRTTSVGSQISIGSHGSGFKPGQPFVHPMAKTPRPYTPPYGPSYASSVNDDLEANESDDVVEDDFRLGGGFRTRRSMSISSRDVVSQNNPTPLSQIHSASDLGLVPKLTNESKTSLGMISSQSDKSIKSKKGRPRGDTDRSQEYILSPSSRPSLDRAFSIVSGPLRSDANEQSREDLIREARRKFEEKEAHKERKYEKQRRDSEAKRQQRRRTGSSASNSLRPVNLKPGSKQRDQASTDGANEARDTPTSKRKDSAAPTMAGFEVEKFRARSYEDYRPANAASLPRYGTRPGESEKSAKYTYATTPPRLVTSPLPSADGGWMRFSTWARTRMLSCGGSRD